MYGPNSEDPAMAMNSNPSAHPFDQATTLEHSNDGVLLGRTHPAYANMVGPFGGITAATMLNAALTHPARLGDPVALTVNYAGPVADGQFHIDVKPVRTNRSSQHWSIVLTQNGEVVTTATAVFALRRQTWTSTEIGSPQVPRFSDIPRGSTGAIAAWTRNYDMRFLRGNLLDSARPEEERDSVSILWIRDEPPRPLDFASLAAMCDAFFPRIMVRRPKRVPFGTVSITIYFHADSEQILAQGTNPLLGTAKASHFGSGFHDQSAEVWSETGHLLATSHQVAYFKE
jgi:acyl-CoA thioesterase